MLARIVNVILQVKLSILSLFDCWNFYNIIMRGTPLLKACPHVHPTISNWHFTFSRFIEKRQKKNLVPKNIFSGSNLEDIKIVCSMSILITWVDINQKSLTSTLQEQRHQWLIIIIFHNLWCFDMANVSKVLIKPSVLKLGPCERANISQAFLCKKDCTKYKKRPLLIWFLASYKFPNQPIHSPS
jgi:hypothetical protein